jgi:isocitrate dehydrogenase (NAD+)
MAEPIRIVVLEGDETGQELLEQAIRVLDSELLELELDLVRFDLSLENRRATSNRVVSDAAAMMREVGLGLKAATITPERAGDVGSPNRILREEVDGKVIVRTGRRIPGVTPVAGVHYPISIVRMAVDDAYGAAERREGEAGGGDEVAFRVERITRSTCRAVAEYAFRSAGRMNARVYGGPKWTVSPVYEGMLKEEMDAAAARHPEVGYHPVLIDATYAGLLSGATDVPLVIPSLNRDGDCLSFDSDYNTTVAMAEAPHGTAPALQGKDVANPLAMILAAAATLRYAGERHRPDAERGSRAIYEAALETVASGCKTPDLGGHAGTTEFTTEVVSRVRTKLEVWSSLGSAA